MADRLVFAQGSTFAPFAVRPAESTATSSSMAARCLRILPLYLTEKEKKRHSISKFGYSRRQEGLAAKRRQREVLARGGTGASMLGIGMSMDDMTSGKTAQLTAHSVMGADSRAELGSPSMASRESDGQEVPSVDLHGVPSKPSQLSITDISHAIDRGDAGAQDLATHSLLYHAGVQGVSTDLTSEDITFLCGLAQNAKVLSQLPMPVLRALCRGLQVRKVPANKIVFKQGSKSDDLLYIIVQGSVDVHMKFGSREKKEQVQTATLSAIKAARKWAQKVRDRAAKRHAEAQARRGSTVLPRWMNSVMAAEPAKASPSPQKRSLLPPPS